MPSIITRIFNSREQAMEAVTELKQAGFTDEYINVVNPPETTAAAAEPAGAADPTIVAAIRQGEVPEANAKLYAEAVQRGGTLVTVRALFGFAAIATEILNKHNPQALDVPDAEYQPPVRDPAAPLSSACGWPVLSHNPTPLSSWLGWRVLSARQHPNITLSKEPAPLSTRLGWRVLLDKPAPLSQRFGWRVLLDKPAPLSQRFGWSLLSRNPAPLSSKLGWRVLSDRKPSATVSDDAAPFSGRFGWKLLSDNPAPLSSWLGWPVLMRPAPPKQDEPPSH